MTEGWARPGPGAVRILVRLTPKSARDGLDAIATADDGKAFLKARVRAVPEDGKANAALEKLVARAAGVARSHVAVVAGQTSRLKTVRIACADPAAVVKRLEAALSAP
ncbi:MAG: UPF0235 protein [Alphaproteobacteria bacterium]|nr:MAG: UPF0235 protein [Alphaproteobacteria bacterium]